MSTQQSNLAMLLIFIVGAGLSGALALLGGEYGGAALGGILTALATVCAGLVLSE